MRLLVEGGGLPQASEHWYRAQDGEPTAYALARRHYSASKNPRPRIRQCIGPGEKMLLLSGDGQAVFAWRYAQYRRDGQMGVECALFRREGVVEVRASDMIREAMEIAWRRWPGQRLFTFVDPRKVRSGVPGYCFRRAGWRHVGDTARGLMVFEKRPAAARLARKVR